MFSEKKPQKLNFPARRPQFKTKVKALQVETGSFLQISKTELTQLYAIMQLEPTILLDLHNETATRHSVCSFLLNWESCVMLFCKCFIGGFYNANAASLQHVLLDTVHTVLKVPLRLRNY